MGKFEKETAPKEKGFMDWELPDIIDWCQKNGQVEWLKAKAAETRERPIYPKKKVARMNPDGTPVLTKKGKQSYTSVMDKTANPIGTKTEPITFVEIKSDFLHTFNLVPAKKPKKPSMYDIINGL